MFHEIMRLVRRHFARDFDETLLFKETLSDLIMASLPHCGESAIPFEGCSGPAEACFATVVESLADCMGADPDRLFFRAANIMLRRMDPYSNILDPGMMKELKVGVSGKFGGIGLVVGRKNGDYVVVSAVEGSPAFEAGFKPGDAVLEIDGQSIRGIPLADVLEKVRGRGGSRICLTVKSRNDATARRVTLRRKVMTIPPVKRAMVADRIGYVKIVNFQSSTSRELQNALSALLQESRGGLRGLVLDLRSNPGGLLEQAVRSADLFLNDRVITYVKAREESANATFRASGRGPLLDCPIIVLIDRGTASSAEILAGALKGLPNVTLMGETSFGKASVQGVFPLPGGMGLRLTTAHYLTPDGRDIDGFGIAPDAPAAESTTGVGERPAEWQANDSLVNDALVSLAVERLLSEEGERSVFSTLF
jgi:carboxyl-terminal processing protease